MGALFSFYYRKRYYSSYFQYLFPGGEIMATDNLKIAKADIEKIIVVGGRTARAAQTIVNNLEEKPDYIINGAHFENNGASKAYGLTISDTIVDGEFINGGNYSTNIYEDEGFAWNNAADMKFTTTSDAKTSHYDYYLGGSPCLIKNGSLNKNKYLATKFANKKTRRIGMGVTDKYLIFSFPNENCTLKNVANKLMAYGCKDAIALDGGGSQYVGKVNNGKVAHLDGNKKNRAVSTWICIYLKKKPKFPKVYSVITSTLNMRTEPKLTAPLYKKAIVSGKLKKNDRITVFEIVYNKEENRYWARSYGYYVALNCLEEV